MRYSCKRHEVPRSRHRWLRSVEQGPVPQKPINANLRLKINEGVVSKETVMLRRWGSSIQKFGFINGVDNVN